MALGAAGWFFFKSHTVIGNGASQVVWMLSTGLFFGLLHRRDQPDAAAGTAGFVPITEHEGVLPSPQVPVRQVAPRPSQAARPVLGPADQPGRVLKPDAWPDVPRLILAVDSLDAGNGGICRVARLMARVLGERQAAGDVTFAGRSC